MLNKEKKMIEKKRKENETKNEFIIRRWKEENLEDRVINLAKLAKEKGHYPEAIGLLENLNQMQVKNKKTIVNLLLQYIKEQQNNGKEKNK